MKKALILLLAFGLVLGACACDDQHRKELERAARESQEAADAHQRIIDEHNELINDFNRALKNYLDSDG